MTTHGDPPSAASGRRSTDAGAGPPPTAPLDVTVVIPNYNYARFLGEAVASALAQTPSVIVVDDGSTEAQTEAALAALPDSVRVLRQANAGLSAARNAGIAASDSEYVLVLDADDRLRPGALAALRGALAAEPSLGFAYGTVHFFGAWEGEMTMPAYDPFMLLYRHTIGSTALMRRALWEDVGGFDPAFRGYEDWEFWLHATARGWRGVKLAVPVLDYRRHGDTMVSGARRSYRSWYRRLRAKHPALYARSGELARAHGHGVASRLVHRLYWGPRPLPAAVEQRLYAFLWRPR